MAKGFSLRRLGGIFVASNQLFLYAACADVSAPTKTAPSQVTAEGRDGITLFRGIFFGEGVVGAQLRDLWQGRGAQARAATPERAAEIRAIEERILAHIQRTDPTFVDRFGAAMQSGNHLQVERSLHEGGLQIADALAADPDFVKAKAAFGVLAAADPYVDIETYVYAVLAVVVFIFAVAVIEPTSGAEVGSPVPASPGLQRDQVVNTIATQLAVTSR